MWRIADGAFLCTKRTVGANRHLKRSEAENIRFAMERLPRDEAFVALLSADPVFTLVGLTFDMRGAQKAQPFGHPLDGRVRRRG